MNLKQEILNNYILTKEEENFVNQTEIDDDLEYFWENFNGFEKDGAMIIGGIPDYFLYEICCQTLFPGNSKYPTNHPIWDCWYGNNKTPKEAWNYRNKNNEAPYIKKAIKNLYTTWFKSCNKPQYYNWCLKIRDIIQTMKEPDIFHIVLQRFTIAKIAPKVTTLSENMFLKILQQAIKEKKIDINKGIYCPMAGFGGIIRGAEKFYKSIGKTDKEIKQLVEAYDINPYLNNWYGWQYRDILAQTIKTDKLVFVCPPFGLKNSEKWKGTDIERKDEYKTNYLEFQDWCKIIQEKIIAPNYIFIGPEEKEKNKNKIGLFSKTLGCRWYREYTK